MWSVKEGINRSLLLLLLLWLKALFKLRFQDNFCEVYRFESKMQNFNFEGSFKIQLRRNREKVTECRRQDVQQVAFLICTAKKKNDWKIQIFSMLLLDIEASDERKEFYANVFPFYCDCFLWKTKSEEKEMRSKMVDVSACWWGFSQMSLGKATSAGEISFCFT